MSLQQRAPMLALVVSNVLRHRTRSVATAFGIALGVGTIVALLSVGAGLKQAAGQLIHLGRADLGVFQSGVQDPTASLLPVSLAERLQQRPDVALATPMLLVVGEVEGSPAAIAFGVQPGGFVARRLVMTQGRPGLHPGDILVGDRLARELHLHPGSRLRVRRREFRVTGIYHSGIFFQDSGATLDLAIHDCGGRKAAGAETACNHHRKLAVLRGFARFHAERLAERAEHLAAAFDVAGRARADHAGVLALRLHAEEVVEGRHAVHPRRWNVQARGDVSEGRFVQVSERLLGRMERFDQRRWCVAMAPHRRIHDAPALVVRGWGNGPGTRDCHQISRSSREMVFPTLSPRGHPGSRVRWPVCARTIRESSSG